MARRKQVYKITYPNGKIYVGMDLTGTLTYFGTPSAKAKERIIAELAGHRLDVTVRKQVLWESETATDAEVRVIEMKLIRESDVNNPAIGRCRILIKVVDAHSHIRGGSSARIQAQDVTRNPLHAANRDSSRKPLGRRSKGCSVPPSPCS